MPIVRMSSPHEWILDSAASFHLTFEPELLYHMGPLETTKGPTMLCNELGEMLPVRGRGRLQTEHLDIPDVLFVPDVRVNLISVDQLGRNHGLETAIGLSKFYVRNPKTGQKVGWGRRRDDGMYVVDRLVITQNNADASLSEGSGGSEADKEWILDSGSRIHYTFNLRLLRGLVTYGLQAIADALPPEEGSSLSSNKQYDGTTTLSWPEGTDNDLGRFVGTDHLYILGRGSVQSEGRFMVPDVRYVQGETRNVISIAQLTRDYGLEMEFQPRRCLVRDPSNNWQVVGMARLRNGVYLLDYLLLDQEVQEDVVEFLPPSGTDSTDAGQELQGPAISHVTGILKLASEAERERFGLSRCGWRPSADGTPRLAIKAGVQAYYACATAASAQHTNRAVYILDTGATHHMTGHKDLIVQSSYTVRDDWTVFLNGIVSNVEVGNGLSIPIHGIGDLETDKFKLEHVLHVEGLEANLVSVGQLVDQFTVQVAKCLWNDGKEAPHHEPVHLHHPGDWNQEVADPLRAQGVPQLLVNELARQMERLEIDQERVTGLAHLIQGRDDNNLQIYNIVRCLESMHVPKALVTELFEQLKIVQTEEPRSRMKGLARRICPAQALFDPEKCLVKVGDFQVGQGVRKGDLYHLLHLRSCPPVTLSLELSDRDPAAGRWVLKKTA